MELIDAAQAMEALGNPTRLAIFRHLVVAGRSGAPVSELQQALDIAPSTLSHHIARLMRHGLLRQERRGRTLICTADYAAMDALVGFLSKECCARDADCAEDGCDGDPCVAGPTARPEDVGPEDTDREEATPGKDPAR